MNPNHVFLNQHENKIQIFSHLAACGTAGNTEKHNLIETKLAHSELTVTTHFSIYSFGTVL